MPNVARRVASKFTVRGHKNFYPAACRIFLQPYANIVRIYRKITYTASGLSTNRLQRFWDLTNGGITRADVRFNYLPGDIVSGAKSDYKIFRINGMTAENVGGAVNPANHTAIVTGVSSFSPRTLGERLVPTAAAVSVGGRVSSATGRGVFGAQLVLINSNGEPRYARTNPFGFYHFSGIAAGETYTINVAHKNYTFASRVVTVTEDLDELNFTANPR